MTFYDSKTEKRAGRRWRRLVYWKNGVGKLAGRGYSVHQRGKADEEVEVVHLSEAPQEQVAEILKHRGRRIVEVQMVSVYSRCQQQEAGRRPSRGHSQGGEVRRPEGLVNLNGWPSEPVSG